MQKDLVFVQVSVLCNNSKSAKHIFDIRRTPVLEFHGNSLDLYPFGEV